MEPPIKSTNQKEWDNYFKAEQRANIEKRKALTRTLKADSSTFQHTHTVKVNGVWKEMPLFSFGDVIVEAKQERIVDNKRFKNPNRKAERKLIQKENRKKK